MRGRLPKKFEGEIVRRRTQVFPGQFRRRIVLEAFVDFVFEFADHGVHQGRRFDFISDE